MADRRLFCDVLTATVLRYAGARSCWIYSVSVEYLLLMSICCDCCSDTWAPHDDNNNVDDDDGDDADVEDESENVIGAQRYTGHRSTSADSRRHFTDRNVQSPAKNAAAHAQVHEYTVQICLHVMSCCALQHTHIFASRVSE